MADRVAQFTYAVEAVLRKDRHFGREGAKDLIVLFPLTTISPVDHLLSVHARCTNCWFYARTGPTKLPVRDTARDIDTPPSNDNAHVPVILNGIDFAYGLHLAVRPTLLDYAGIGESIVLAFALFDNDEQPACACSEALFARVSPEHWDTVIETRQPEVR